MKTAIITDYLVDDQSDNQKDPYQDCRRGGHVWTAGASGLGRCLILILRAGGLGCRADLRLGLVQRLRLAVVVAYVTVHGCAGIAESPVEDLGIPRAPLEDRGGGGFVAAESSDSVLRRTL